MRTYSKDPYWTTARFAGASSNKDGQPIRKGDRIFIYKDGTTFVGAEAEAASADFQACAADESFYNGESY